MLASKRVLAVALALMFSLGTAYGYVGKAWAEYSVSFASPSITITAPSRNNAECSGKLLIEGTSTLTQVWICLRGPEKELETYSVPVKEGRFSRTVDLRFGPGIYTVWAGDNPRRFDGSIRFTVNSLEDEDWRYISPSAYVDSDSAVIKSLAESLVDSGASDMDKVRSIHAWVTQNIAYDCAADSNTDSSMVPASQTVTLRKGICLNYALVTAALARAVGLPAKVVYGQAGAENDGFLPQLHAWNEILVDGKWVPVDATWDAGYIKDGRFIRKPSTTYFNPDESLWRKTHHPLEVTLD